MKNKMFLFILILCLSVHSQNTVIMKGIITDTVKKEPVSNVLILASKLTDSTLAGFTRTDKNGYFELHLPLDTFQISFHHTEYGEKFVFILADKQNNYFDFGKIIMPPKEHQLDEIVIYADREPVYYKGDTLIYIADSFKVKPDATVEDLLKKLPGIQVDKSGKIKAQGKEVDKVLVDGDEFFGSDPTLATKNLQAQQVENIQVYEQKNQETADNTDKEALQIMNIQLKDAAKKGYFGKAYAGTDAKKFYESQLMFNRFDNRQKISIFGLSGNTPDFDMSWSDMDKYGLSNEMDYFYNEDEDMYLYEGSGQNGIPKISKGGIYYNNKWKKIKLNTNYSAYQNILKVIEKESSQYFLTDTLYYTNKQSNTYNQSDIHKFNFKAEINIDSLNTISVTNSSSYQKNKYDYTESTDFSNSRDLLFRTTNISEAYFSENLKTNNTIKYVRNFNKKDRSMIVRYTLNYNKTDYNGNLNTINLYYITMPSLPSFNQKKIKTSEVYFHKISTEYTEPISKYFQLNMNYSYQYSTGKSDWRTFNPNTQNDYVILDSTFSNFFQPKYFEHNPSMGFRWNKSKAIFSAHIRYRYFDIQNTNFSTQQNIHYSVTNWLPRLSLNYKFNKTTNLHINYHLTSNLPDLQKLQPVPNNSNPNNINIGNPYLLPTIEHNIRTSFYTFRPVTNQYFWLGSNYSIIERDFSSSVNYDNTGRSITQIINTKDNYTFNAYAGATIKLLKNIITINQSYYYAQSKRQNIVNQMYNYTQNQTYVVSFNPEINLEKEKYIWNFGITFSYNYYIPKATLNNNTNQPYSNYNYGANTSFNFFERYELSTDATYEVYQNYANGYNPQPIIWNASVSAKVGKNKNLKLSFLAKDILNQSVSIQRNISTNVITDRQVNIIRRYFLFQITYNFSSNNNNNEEDEE